MKLNRVYLHVGMQKTATSSIQQSLSANRKILKKNLILYPSSWSNWHVNEVGALLHEEQEEERRNILHRKNFTDTDRINIVEKIKNEIINSECESLIISAESIILYSTSGLLKLKNIIQNDLNIKNITVIISTRNIIDFINSYVQQLIKSSFDVNHNELVKKTIYERQITRFEEVFGQENLMIYSFEKAQMHPMGVVGEFFEKIGIDKENFTCMKTVRVNEGISDLACEIINYINMKEPFTFCDKLSIKRKVGDTQLLQKLSGRKFIMDSKFQKLLLKNSLDDREWLKKKYNIDYMDLKTTKRPEPSFNKMNVMEFQEIFPKLDYNIQKIVIMYLEESLRNAKFYEINKKRNLKRCLKLIPEEEYDN